MPLAKLSETLREILEESLPALFGEELVFGRVLKSEGSIRGRGPTTQCALMGQVQGVLLIEATSAAASKVVGLMLCEDDPSEEDMLDGLGEIANVIVGAVKGYFAQEGYAVKIGLPQSTVANPADAEHTITLRSDTPTQWVGHEVTIAGQELLVHLASSLAKVETRETPKILVVEDDPLTGKILVRCLQKQGWEVFLATDAIAGIQLAAAERCDLVFTDIRLPNVSGAAVVGALQLILPDTAIVVCSGMSVTDVETECGPAFGHIARTICKPADHHQIATLAAELLTAKGFKTAEEAA